MILWTDLGVMLASQWLTLYERFKCATKRTANTQSTFSFDSLLISYYFYFRNGKPILVNEVLFDFNDLHQL